MNRITKSNLLAAAIFCCVVFISNIGMACPTCKDGMAGDPAYSNMVNGYFWSIIFMMSMPFLVFTTVCAYFYYEVCRARARQAATTAAILPNEVSVDPEAAPGPEIALQN